MARESSGRGLAALALVVALAALFVAWSAYKRTGGDLDQLIRMKAEGYGETAAGEASWQDDLARARERLLRRRSDVEGERDLDQVRRDVAEIRRDLERAFDDAGEQARERWRTMDAELERLEAQLDERGSRAKETLDSLLDKMRD
ncbi:MAG TPA: hypothetical protein VF756_22070 [Thermoanaerobaculia bacterium]